ncbi:MAG TPA: quinone-dependent dihydroorotate dehydrogenase [Gallionellaceae bacterium]|jgi:dihydroorotate dehydrogenase|nr:MAG: dihydroorotate dehydrogenase (quinone) [Gallionellales bacterium 24-53-125]OZB10598.1 MAG: dihydroorotate dehydrogenase (quinone) [Gallionellales bacterium 39-52-133]HQS57231.1 quinone-dependent dihydroorotate dehydrogenase [Gallionellaceae bacterium]HQS74581.1 quinone-dependent dihydroorotate dehydrogenase [Gallionellaceae bacterium]
MYSLLRPLLFTLDPETAHHVTLDALQAAYMLGLLPLIAKQPAADPRTVMGIHFPNPVGLAAGLDKNGAYIDALGALGFGFIEIGTVTPRPQPGNPKPRLFRLPQAQGIINRMGFNNLGVDALLENVKNARYHGVLGINIGKNFDTPIERAADDYLIGLRKVYSHASYVAINISSPNTKNLRQLQGGDELDALLSQLKVEQEKLAELHGKYVPLALKIAPDLDSEQIQQIAALLMRHRIDGVIATNTTLSRAGVEHLPLHGETGGLSGAPVREKSTEVIRQLAAALQGALPIIGVGGILKGADAMEKMQAGAALVQVYSGLIYRGTDLLAECADAIKISRPI